jgi:hypothetical protein
MVGGTGAGAASKTFRYATHVLSSERPNPFAASRRVSGPRCLPMRRIAVRVAGTGSRLSDMVAVNVRPAGLLGDGTRRRLKTGAAKRSVRSSVSVMRCRACRRSPTAMLICS